MKMWQFTKISCTSLMRRRNRNSIVFVFKRMTCKHTRRKRTLLRVWRRAAAQFELSTETDFRIEFQMWQHSCQKMKGSFGDFNLEWLVSCVVHSFLRLTKMGTLLLVILMLDFSILLAILSWSRGHFRSVCGIAMLIFFSLTALLASCDCRLWTAYL